MEHAELDEEVYEKNEVVPVFIKMEGGKLVLPVYAYKKASLRSLKNFVEGIFWETEQIKIPGPSSLSLYMTLSGTPLDEDTMLEDLIENDAISLLVAPLVREKPVKGFTTKEPRIKKDKAHFSM